MAPEILASILVPVLNEERYIASSVAAMRRQRVEGALEFLFADGGSSDATIALLTELSHQDPRIRILPNPRGTVSSGLNVALRHARGRYAVRMDAHTIYPEDYVRQGIDRLGRGDTRWVSGPQIPEGHGPVSRAVALALSGAAGRGGSRKWGSADGPAGEFDLDTGVFAGVWERATLLEYGGWDERWPRNSDSEMAARFLARGERLVCLPAMGARYVPRDSIQGLWRQYLGYGEYRARTSRYHPHSMRRSHLLAPGIVLCGLAALAAPARARRLARAGEAIYLTALLGAAVRCARRDGNPRDAALVPVTLWIMHHAHGVGQLRGWARHGPPWRAGAQAFGLPGARRRPADHRDRVFAPSL